MLIRFKAENWKSFPLLDFSAIAGKEQLYGDRVARIARPKMRLLPIAAVFGGNASGKSNFFEALDFARRYIVDGVRPGSAIGVKPFALNREETKKPTSFEFEILADERAFRYSFAATRSVVLFESLTEIRKTVERVLFERRGEEIRLGGKLGKNDALDYVGRGTQDNLLFLTNSVLQKRDEFRPVYDWFRNSLLLISPNASGNAADDAERRLAFRPPSRETLEAFDVGIERIDAVDVPWSQVPFQIAARIRSVSENLPEDATFRIGPYLVRNVSGEAAIRKMVAVHSLEDDPKGEIAFELADESDGTRRLLDLVPALATLRDSKESRVVFIDEIDRSLHHLLTRKALEDYLDECSEDSRSQLFFTTHDALLIDQNLLRRDEIWFVEKENNRSSLVSVADFNIRRDKSLLNAYLFGRFGGVPYLRRG